MSGSAVLAVQKRLVALGYAPGALDSAYGPTVAAAVKAFQRDRKLEADGVVGPLTLATLKEKPAKATTAGPAATPAAAPTSRRLQGRSSPGERAPTEAITHIGFKEKPTGSNKTAFDEWFGVNGVPWCNIFVSYCFQVGAATTICKGFKGAGAYPGKGSTYVPTTEAWLRAAGLWLGRSEPILLLTCDYSFVSCFKKVTGFRARLAWVWGEYCRRRGGRRAAGSQRAISVAGSC